MPYNPRGADPVVVTFGTNGSGPPWIPTSSDNPLPVTISGASASKGPFTDRSGSIAVGATSQVLAPANATRSYVIIRNISADRLWINFGVAAVEDQPSMPLDPLEGFVMEGTFINNQAIDIIGPNSGAKFTAKEG